MNLSIFKDMAPSCGDFISVLPEFSLAVFAALLLIVSAVSSQKRCAKVSVLAILATLVSLVLALFFADRVGEKPFGGMISAYGAFTYFAYLCAVLTGALAVRYLSKNPSNHKSEYIPVLMMASAALSLLSRAENFVFLFVALECFSICMYALVSWSRKSVECLDGSIKYMIISGVSSAILLLGIVFIYGASLNKFNGGDLLFFDNIRLGLSSKLFCTGLVLVFSGLLFKLAAFPFQFWVSDVYQAAPTPTSAFLAVASKAVAIFMVVKLCIAGHFNLQNVLVAVSVIASLTILAGNIPAVLQTCTKRLMALSGVANAGYLMLLAAAAVVNPANYDMIMVVMFFYLVAYAFATYSLFGIINMSNTVQDSLQNFEDYRGLFKKDKITTSALVVALASLAGIPPTAGFFGKVLIIVVAWGAGLYIPVAVMIFGSVVSIYYYFAWMRIGFAKSYDNAENFKFTKGSALLLTILTGATLAFGFVSIYFY